MEFSIGEIIISMMCIAAVTILYTIDNNNNNQ